MRTRNYLSMSLVAVLLTFGLGACTSWEPNTAADPETIDVSLAKQQLPHQYDYEDPYDFFAFSRNLNFNSNR